MNGFVSSDGTPVHIHDEDGAVRLFTSMPDGTYPMQAAAGDDVQAIREFFRAEEDERLGRIRSEVDPDIVIYPVSTNQIRIIDQASHGNWATFDREDADGLGPMSRSAAAYFDAHPEPKPWHEAKEGEVWLITFKGNEYPAIFQAGAFRDSGGSWDVDRITAGRRIWPEVAS